MTVGEFVARLKTLKKTVDGSPELSPETRSAVDALLQAFRAAYDPQRLKKAMASDSNVSSDLEERLTTAALLVNQDRARQGS